MRSMYLVTGTAGFIGHFVAQKLIEQGEEVLGLDNINEYYDQGLKFGRLEASGFDPEEAKAASEVITSKTQPKLKFIRAHLEDKEQMQKIFEDFDFEVVIHLAAQAGVRYSLENPHAYIDSNITGTLNILEGCRHQKVSHLVFASSSSVYGLNQKAPFQTKDPVDHPVSLYASTKRSNELMAHNYAHLFNLPVTGLRFFTVYGPWGRPDMALFKFTKGIINSEEIEVYNNGQMSRDFTYVDDVAEGVVRVAKSLPKPAQADRPDTSSAPFKIYNIGRSEPVGLLEFINSLEKAIGKKAQKKMMPMQAGDVEKTFADVEELFEVTEFKPRVEVGEGVEAFADWYKSYYKI